VEVLNHLFTQPSLLSSLSRLSKSSSHGWGREKVRRHSLYSSHTHAFAKRSAVVAVRLCCSTIQTHTHTYICIYTNKHTLTQTSAHSSLKGGHSPSNSFFFICCVTHLCFSYLLLASSDVRQERDKKTFNNNKSQHTDI
jgi:hypothetical protein